MATTIETLATLCALAMTLPAQDSRPATQPVTLGEGAHRYTWVAGWGQLPAGMQYGNTHGGIVVTKKGEVLVNTDTKNAILVFTTGGKFVRAFGEEFAGGLHGMCLVEEQGEEFLYLAHTGRHCAAKCTLAGKVLWTLGPPQAAGIYKNDNEYLPTAVAVAPNGDLFVADGYGKSWVHQFDKERKYLRSIGGPGTEPGKFKTPHGLWIDTRGSEPELLVADRENHRLQRFDLQGQHKGVIDGMFRRPCGAHQSGGLLAVADLAGRVTLLGKDNQLVAQLGDQPDPKLRAQNGVPREKWKDGEFLSPHGLRFDAEGNLYVMDWNSLGRVNKLTPVR